MGQGDTIQNNPIFDSCCVQVEGTDDLLAYLAINLIQKARSGKKLENTKT
jgi:hypothetical protein